ncbi:hypothetical protein ACIPSA_21525 [Streptomyces sp. NPDC086549]|uniref:hypothetical protein n=1 Tax=Streptomyces sp. NPDC086549 TaxID=3365752 RepID=UPI00381BC524
MRKIAQMALVGALAAASLGLTGGTASALESDCWPSQDDNGTDCRILHQDSKGYYIDSVQFNSYGEHLQEWDYATNGEGVMADINDDRYYWLVGDYYDWNLSYDEGSQIWLTSCQFKAGGTGSPYDCYTRLAIA